MKFRVFGPRTILSVFVVLASVGTARSLDTQSAAEVSAAAAKVDLGVRAQRRLNRLPDEIRNDLIEKLEKEKEVLHTARERFTGVKKPRPSNAAQVKLNSLNSQLTAVADLQSIVTNSISDAQVPVFAPTAITYKPEYILRILNPSYAICDAHIWNTPGFPYQAQLDKNVGAIFQTAQAVGLFMSYKQSNKSGMPAAGDILLAAAGTGIAVGSDLVLTNQHVAANMVVDPTLPPNAWQLNSAKARFIIRFPVETTACRATAKTASFEITELVYVGLGPTFADDIAVLRVKALDNGALQPVVFAADPYSGDEYLGVIGYPDRPDPTDYVPPTGNGLFPDAVQLEAYFDLPNNQLPKYRIERFGFGTLVDLNDPEKRMIGHDAPTDNSSSGSLVIALGTGKPIALHAGGNPGTGAKSGVNVAYRGDYIVAQLKAHGVLPP